jgi:hypothetical protein
MRADELITRLHEMTADEIRSVAGGVREAADTAEGEVAWWRATVAVSSALRRQRRSREAAALAHDASAAVLAAADRAGVRETEHATVTVVARAAAELARAVTAELRVDRETETLFAVWQRVPVPA